MSKTFYRTNMLSIFLFFALIGINHGNLLLDCINSYAINTMGLSDCSQFEESLSTESANVVSTVQSETTTLNPLLAIITTTEITTTQNSMGTIEKTLSTLQQSTNFIVTTLIPKTSTTSQTTLFQSVSPFARSISHAPSVTTTAEMSRLFSMTNTKSMPSTLSSQLWSTDQFSKKASSALAQKNTVSGGIYERTQRSNTFDFNGSNYITVESITDATTKKSKTVGSILGSSTCQCNTTVIERLFSANNDIKRLSSLSCFFATSTKAFESSSVPSTTIKTTTKYISSTDISVINPTETDSTLQLCQRDANLTENISISCLVLSSCVCASMTTPLSTESPTTLKIKTTTEIGTTIFDEIVTTTVENTTPINCLCDIHGVENLFSITTTIVALFLPDCRLLTPTTVLASNFQTTPVLIASTLETTPTFSSSTLKTTGYHITTINCLCDIHGVENLFSITTTIVALFLSDCRLLTPTTVLASNFQTTPVLIASTLETTPTFSSSTLETTPFFRASTLEITSLFSTDSITTGKSTILTSTENLKTLFSTSTNTSNSAIGSSTIATFNGNDLTGTVPGLTTKKTNCQCNIKNIETIMTTLTVTRMFSLSCFATVSIKPTDSLSVTTTSNDVYNQTSMPEINNVTSMCQCNSSSEIIYLNNLSFVNLVSPFWDQTMSTVFSTLATASLTTTIPEFNTTTNSVTTTAIDTVFDTSTVTALISQTENDTNFWLDNSTTPTISMDGSKSSAFTSLSTEKFSLGSFDETTEFKKLTSFENDVTTDTDKTTTNSNLDNDKTSNVSSTNAAYIDSVTPISSVTNGENYSTDSEKTSSRTKMPSLKCKNFGVITENGTCKCAEGYFGEECDTVLPSSSSLAKTNSFTTTENIKTTTPTNSAIDEKDSTDSKETSLKTETPSLQCKNSGTYNENGTCTCTDGYFGEECDAALPSSTLATASVVVGVAIAASQSSSSKLKYLWPRYSTLVRTPITPHEFFRLMGTYFLTVALGINSMLGLPSTSDIEHLPKCAMAYLFGTGAFFLSLTAMIFEAGIDALTLSGMRFNAWARPAERRTRCFSFVPTFILYVLIGIAPTAGLWLKHWTDVVTSRSCIGALGYGDFSRDMKTASWLQLAVTLFYLTVAAVLGLLAVACNKFDVCRCRRRTEAWSINPFIYGHEIWPLEANAYFWLVAIQPVLFSVCWLSYMLVNEQRTTAVQWINLILTSIYSATSSLQSALTTSGQLSNTVCSGMTMIPEGMLSFMPPIDHVSLKDKRSILKAQMHAKDWEKFEQKELNNGPVPLYPVRNDSIPFGLTQYMCSLWTVNYMRLRERGSTVDDSLKTMACQFLEQLPDLRTINTLQFAYLFAHWISEVRDKDSDAVSPAILKKSRRILDRQMDLNVPPPMIVINENGTETVYRRQISHLTPMDGQKKVVRARKESKHCDIALDDTQPAFIGPKCQENAVHALVPHELVVAFRIDHKH